MKKIFTLGLLSAAMLFASCEDEPYESQYQDFRQSEAYTYMPMETGSYWVFEVDYINEDGTPYTGTDMRYQSSTDSVVITNSGLFKGREGFIAQNINLESGLSTEVHYAFVGNSLYVYAEPLEGAGIQYGPQGWTEVFDLDYNSKNLLDQSFSTKDEDNQMMPYMDLTFNYMYEILPGTKEEIIQGEGQWDIMTIEYTNTINTRQVVPSLPDVNEENISTDVRKLAKNIGPVYSETSTSTAGFLSGEEEDTPIRVQKLIRYKL